MKSKAVEEGMNIINIKLPYCIPSSKKSIRKALEITDNSARADERKKYKDKIKTIYLLIERGYKLPKLEDVLK